MPAMDAAERASARLIAAAAPGSLLTGLLSFLDEAARASHQDPIALRLRHLDDARGIDDRRLASNHNQPRHKADSAYFA